MWTQLIPRPPFDVHPILPDLTPAFKAAYLTGMRDGAVLTAILLLTLYLLLKEFWKK